MRTTRALLVLLTLAPTVLAQTDDERNTAREFGKQGQEALDKGDAKTAEDRFHRAVQIFDAAKAVVPPTLLLGYARGASKNNHFIEAEEAYNRVIRAGVAPGAPAAFVKAFEDAKHEIDGVSPHIAHVTINVAGCDNPSVTLDGATLPSMVLGVKKPIDPGTHEVKATATGCKSGNTSFTVGDGAETSSTLTLEKEAVTTVTPPINPPPDTTTTTTPPPNTNPPPGADTGSSGSGLRTAGWVTFGVGGVGLVVGAIFAGVAASTHSDLANKCPGGMCPSTAQSELDGYHFQGALSTVGFIAGPVLMAIGITMVLVAPSKKSEKAAWIRPVIGFGSIGAVGAF
jgi:hypothetical protein